jgi:hypothetical protein
MRIWNGLAALVVLAGLSTASAHAGNINLVSDTWDNICKVEVMTGLNAPGKGQVQPFSNVSKGWHIVGVDRICYRRSGNPTDCRSALSQWNCSSNPISGTATSLSLGPPRFLRRR